ncbi:MAG: hypothetical protein JRF15_12580 [Deltaproteobacteria bacterium]|jgi:hypothetical protein|nr:hypothetical protein [Deltaproteobacteria bacterium]
MLVLWAVLFVQSSFFESPEFRVWESIRDDETQRFAANQQIAMQEIGDLGRLSWVRSLQVPREVVFTTDRWGLRNPIEIEHPRVVVLGDSYVAGSSVTDRETLTVAMSRELREPIYNFAVQSVDVPALFLRDPRFAENPPEIVIWAPVARQIRPRPLAFPALGEDSPSAFESALFAIRRAGEALEGFEGRLNRDNGLTHWARYLYNELQHRWFGNPNLIDTPEGRFLALGLEDQGLTVSAEEREVETVIAMVQAFSTFLAEHRVHLIYCPIPESGTIYPEFFPEEAREALALPSFLDRLIDGSRARGVQVVDLRPIFRANKFPYLYQPDDSHWNPRGIQLAASALAEAVRDFDDNRIRSAAVD